MDFEKMLVGGGEFSRVGGEWGLCNIFGKKMLILWILGKKRGLLGGGVVMPKYFYGFEKMLGGLCQNILWKLKKCQQIGGGGGGVMPKYFIDLKKCWGGVCGRMPKHFRDLKKMLVGGGGCYAQIFYRLEKMLGGGVCQQIYGLEKC